MMSMEIDHYYTQRDVAPSQRPCLSAPNTPARSAGSVGKIRLPPLHGKKFTIPLSDDEDDDFEDNKEDADRLLNSVDLTMSVPRPRARKVAGSRRVASAQIAKERAGWQSADRMVLNPGYAGPELPTPQIFQSISASPYHGARSFEELRAECYTQSLVATGAPPPPAIPAAVTAFGAIQKAQCIPPTFQPWVVANQAKDSMDVEML